MRYYKNVLNEEVVGLTESPYELHVENFYEVTKEEYIELGGHIREEAVQERALIADPLIDALID